MFLFLKNLRRHDYDDYFTSETQVFIVNGDIITEKRPLPCKVHKHYMATTVVGMLVEDQPTMPLPSHTPFMYLHVHTMRIFLFKTAKCMTYRAQGTLSRNQEET